MPKDKSFEDEQLRHTLRIIIKWVETRGKDWEYPPADKKYLLIVLRRLLRARRIVETLRDEHYSLKRILSAVRPYQNTDRIDRV